MFDDEPTQVSGHFRMCENLVGTLCKVVTKLDTHKDWNWVVRARFGLGLVLVSGLVLVLVLVLELVIGVSFSVNSNSNPNLTLKLTTRSSPFSVIWFWSIVTTLHVTPSDI